MGNTCKSASRNVTVPSRVILVQVNPKQHKQPLFSALSIKSELSTLPQTVSLKSYQSEVPSGGDLEEEIKTNYTYRPPSLKYDLLELGIGEYYLENEFAEPLNKDPKNKQKSQAKAGIEWDTAVVQMRVKFPQNSQDSAFHSQIESCLKEYSTLRPKAFEKMLNDGPPMRYRWAVWKILVEPDQFYVSDLYEKLKKLSSPCENDIRKDLHRTFPDEQYFSSERFNHIGQEQLFNVLKAISLYLPNVGYTQSMNFLVGFLLLISGGNELETFWMFVTLARDHRFLLMGFFEKEFPLLKFYIFVFYELLELEMPALHAHLKQQQIPDELWILKWYFTVFLYSLPPKHAVRIWDFIMTEGMLGIIKVTLGLLKIIEKDMLQLDAFGMDLLFQHLKNEGNRMTNISHVNNTLPQNQSVIQNCQPTSNQSNIINPNQSNIVMTHQSNLIHNQSNLFQANSQIHVQNMSHRSYIQVNQSNIQNHSNTNALIPLPNQNVTNADNGGPLITVNNESDEVQYSIQELDIDEVLNNARQVMLTVDRMLYFVDLYPQKAQVVLPKPYNQFFRNLHLYQTDVNKVLDLQNEIDFHLMRSELSDKPKEEIVVSNLLEEEETLILKDLAL